MQSLRPVRRVAELGSLGYIARQANGHACKFSTSRPSDCQRGVCVCIRFLVDCLRASPLACFERSLPRHPRFRPIRGVRRSVTARCYLPTARIRGGRLVCLVMEDRAAGRCGCREHLRRRCIVGSIVHDVSMIMLPNKTLQRTAASRSRCNRCRSSPPSLSFIR